MVRIKNIFIVLLFVFSISSCKNNNEVLKEEIKSLEFENQKNYSYLFGNYHLFEYKDQDVIVEKENNNIIDIKIYNAKNNEVISNKDVEIGVTLYDVIDKFGVPNYKRNNEYYDDKYSIYETNEMRVNVYFEYYDNEIIVSAYYFEGIV